MLQMAQKRISEMDGEKSANDFRVLVQYGAVALPNHPLERTGDSMGFSFLALSPVARRSPAALGCLRNKGELA